MCCVVRVHCDRGVGYTVTQPLMFERRTATSVPRTADEVNRLLLLPLPVSIDARVLPGAVRAAQDYAPESGFSRRRPRG